MLIIIQRAVVQYVKNIGVRNKTSHVNNKKIYKSRDLEIVRIYLNYYFWSDDILWVICT